MLVVPAIDLLGGRPVRLTQGDFSRQTDYQLDAVAAARELERAGASWLHLVDLDAARGSGDNRAVIEAIRAAVSIRLQVGGGVRELGDAERLIAAGIDRVVVGSALAADPGLPARWAARVGGRLVAGIDAAAGQVRVAGWTEGASATDTELAEQMRDQPVAGIVYTSIEQDGTLAGPDLPRTVAVARAAGRPVLASGGIGSVADIDAVAAVVRQSTGVVGTIVGKGWYEGQVDLGVVFARYPQAAAADAW